MNINKYFLNLPETTQNAILEAEAIDTTTSIKCLYVYEILFPQHIDFIYTDKRYERICDLIVNYVSRINYYKRTGNSFGQYLRSLDKKLGLV